MKPQPHIQILLLFICGFYGSARCQEQSFDIRFQNIEQRLFTEKYWTINLKTTVNENETIYKIKNEKYTWKKESATLKKYVDDELIGYLKLDTNRKETHEILGIIYPYTFIAITSIEEKKRQETEKKKLDSINKINSANGIIRLGTSSMPFMLDAGVSRWWSEKFGNVMSRAYMTQSGKVIYSINGNVIHRNSRYELFFK